MIQTLDAKQVALQGINLIEASAGTGKTWTISWLYLRLIVINGMKVDQILVVTYTDAATSELRDRIRRRLADALAYLQQRPCEEPQEYTHLNAEVELAEAIRRLQLALVSFDEAAVFTIHSFCKRVLAENAFEARLPFESELLAREDYLLTELADQFWYQHFLQPDTLHLHLLQQHKLSPDSLLHDVRVFIGKPYLKEDLPSLDGAALEQALQQTLTCFQHCQQIWQRAHEDIVALLLNGSLNGRSYRKDYVASWASKMTTLLAMSQPKWRELDESFVERFTTGFIATKVKKGKQPPEHEFFVQITQLLEHYMQLQQIEAQALEALRMRLLHYLRQQLPARKQQEGVLTFDDLLLNLQQALQADQRLAPRLAQQYQAALIDEFQDTDPIQYDIFATIYRNAQQPCVFYVGDPKQAIYGFRGADIHTYLSAARQTDHRYTLKKNYRSHQDLLAALNHLFKQSQNPFRSEIAYEPVEAGKTQADLFFQPQGDEQTLAPLRIWDWDRLAKTNVADIQVALAGAVADDIARLLSAAQQGRARIGERALESKDIAVLVREHRQGDLVKQALLQRGIASVQQTRESVFNTREASELRQVLRAVAEPSRESLLRQALVTELLGYDAAQLLALEAEPERLERCFEDFFRWHNVWLQQGFMPMLRQLLLDTAAYARLLATADGERRLTNLLHLAELVHTENRLYGHGMHALVRWLQKTAADHQDEVSQLRLESDENLVQIVTIHKSKGLEYSVVYCPFLWKESVRQSAWFSWHDAATSTSRLQAAQLATEQQQERFYHAEYEESLRLLYVALTRAKYHCTVALVSGDVQTGGHQPFHYQSALTWLLFGSLENRAELLAEPNKMPAEERQQCMLKHLQQIITDSQSLLSYASCPEVIQFRYQAELQLVNGQVRAYQHQLPAVPRVGSFSGLISGHEDERPDHDDLLWSLPSARVLPSEQTDELPAFPRGANAGSCLHKLLEDLDFTQPVVSQQDEIVIPTLERYGFAAAQWLDSAQHLLQQVLYTPLNPQPALSLSELSRTQRLDELEFYFPVNALQLTQWQQILHEHLPKTWGAIHEAIDNLQFKTLQGFMKGFVDLIFVAQGRYYVVDYKSNDLGGDELAYSFNSLQQAMADHHYYLQYLIYCVALHRYLQQRVVDYSWDTHMGGVLYLFLRGMQANTVSEQGIFFHQPSYELIAALEQALS